MIKQIATAICLFACIAPALADDEKDKRRTPSPIVCPSVAPGRGPEEHRASSNRLPADMDRQWRGPKSADSSLTPEVRRVSSGDEGLIQFTVSGAQAVMVSNHELCARQCIKGATCSTVGSYDINIYVRTGHAWRTALSTRATGDVFLSTGWVKENIFEFNALVLRVSGIDKNCRVKDWKQFCDMLIKWDGKKFTYKPL